MIDNPYDAWGGDRFRAAAWGRGYLFGLTGPVGLAGDEIGDVADCATVAPTELSEPFIHGTRSGRYAADGGLDIFGGTIDTAERGYFPATAALRVDAGDLDPDVVDMVTLASSAFSMVLMAFTNVVLANHESVPADRVSTALTRHFGDTVASLGRPPCDFFFGGAVDFADSGAEMRLTPLFRSRPAAQGAVADFGRPRSFVASWSSDRCERLTVLDAHWPARRVVRSA